MNIKNSCASSTLTVPRFYFKDPIKILITVSSNDSKLEYFKSVSAIETLEKNILYGKNVDKSGNFEMIHFLRNKYNTAWIRNCKVSSCMLCNKSFGLITRKHHCRRCGYIICNNCSLKRLKIPELVNIDIEVDGSRVCDKCSIPIRFIDFEKFKTLSQMPRFPENASLCVSMDEIVRENSLIIFISHCWMRGHAATEGYDGRAHPDNANHDKFKLCLSGIEKVKSKFAPGMQHCYVWLDFGCLNQDTDPTAEMGGRLDRVVEFCDCLFSPIHGEDANMSLTIQNSYDDYDVVTWNGERGYTKKAWCRLEMFYAANIPMKKNSTRAQNFRYGLKDRALESCRPHLLYGTSEMMKGKAPQMLPPLQNSFYDKLDPMTGSLTNEAEDRPKIQRLVDQLKPFMKVIEVGYTGDKNEDNEMHGQGKYRYSDGSVYKGKFENNKKNGRGTYKYASGSLYDGNFKDDKIHGQGIYKSPNGDKYVGTFAFGLRNGRGVYTHPGDSECNGDSIYDGEWKNSLRQGQGKQIKDGIVTHNGYWENDQPSQQKGLFSPFWG